MATVLEQVQEKYELIGKMREGGMGAIFKVRHKLLGEERVVKIMRPQLEGDKEFALRFTREAQTLIRLRHPNIAQLYDFFADEAGNAAMVMEFIPGVDLRELLRRHGPPSLGLAVEIAVQSLEAIGFLHRRKMVHRDISPDNLMLARDADGRPLVKLIDLGIVKVLEAEATGLTSTGMFIGKVRYASPEQFKTAEGGMLDQRSDLYSFGVVFYELLTGRLPLMGDTASALIAAHLYHPPLGFDVTDPQGRVPEDLRQLVLQLLAKEPTHRPPNAEAVQDQLRHLQGRYKFSPQELAILLPPPEEAQPTTLVAPPASPSLEVQAVPTAPTAIPAPTEATLPAPTPPAPQTAPAPRQKASRWLVLAAAAALLFTAGGALFLLKRGQGSTAATPATIPAAGTLVVHAIPWARVAAIKDSQGQSIPLPADAVTPLSLALPAGSYQLELQDPESGETVKALVQVLAGTTTRTVIPVRALEAEQFLQELGWR
ncbi:MAG: serine/threonine protein kinase [Thermoanaerobaculum sp.]|nr:serine/threonine protein kinase [Thermoanaerobaculum sp.]MDW7967319.1 serine/threonine-protein kinase [Thermoanaerobaculum sp.]